MKSNITKMHGQQYIKKILREGVFLPQLCTEREYSISRIVWVTANCRFTSDMVLSSVISQLVWKNIIVMLPDICYICWVYITIMATSFTQFSTDLFVKLIGTVHHNHWSKFYKDPPRKERSTYNSQIFKLVNNEELIQI